MSAVTFDTTSKMASNDVSEADLELPFRSAVVNSDVRKRVALVNRDRDSRNILAIAQQSLRQRPITLLVVHSA